MNIFIYKDFSLYLRYNYSYSFKSSE